MRCGISDTTAKFGRILITSLGLAETEHGRHFLRGDYGSYIHSLADPSAMSREHYLLSEVFSKFPFDLGFDRSSVAVEKFLTVESTLASSDALLKQLISDPSRDPEFHWVFHSMKRKISRCLGLFSWSSCERYFSFGPGASYGVQRRIAYLPNKYGKQKPSVTQNCLDLAVAALRSHSVWSDYHTTVSGRDHASWFSQVPGNKIVTVPKNSKTDRVIAIEPLMNMYVQKGIGAVIRRRLRNCGVNLNDQRPNQVLARKGSLGAGLATVDLSSASDSISWFLVQELLPPDWVSAIELCRSPRGVLPSGDVIRYRKVSSMGNGFTFELESLIFWALCSACTEYLRMKSPILGVYGDDLVVPVDSFELVERMLSKVGFSTNSKKTHVDGPFRESCGKHYFLGLDYSPFYIRENLENVEKATLYCNLLRQWSLLSTGYGCDARLSKSWYHLYDQIPCRFKTYGPLFLGNQLNDRAVGLDFDECAPSRARNFIEGYYQVGLKRGLKRIRFDVEGSLIGALDKRDGSSVGEISSALVEGRLTTEKSLVAQWHYIGPWI